VLVGVDMAKEDHYAQAITSAGEEVLHRPIHNDETAIEDLIADVSQHGRVVFVIDMPSCSAQLLLEIPRRHEIGVAYVTGLQMRRAAELYAGAAKTEPRVNAARNLTPFHRLNIDPPAGVQALAPWSIDWGCHRLGGLEAAVSSAVALWGCGFVDAGLAASVGGLAAGGRAEPPWRAGLGVAEEALNSDDDLASAALADDDLPEGLI